MVCRTAALHRPFDAILRRIVGGLGGVLGGFFWGILGGVLGLEGVGVEAYEGGCVLGWVGYCG